MARFPSYGYRCEGILRRLGILSPSYVAAGVLEDNIEHSRKLAQNAIQRKVRTKRLQNKLLTNDKAGTLCLNALRLNVDNNEEFHKFVEYMENALDLLKISRVKI